MPTYRAPDVYIEEIPVFPPSVAEVETAIPAFIGYTEKAAKNIPNDLILKPTKVYSLKEYELYYGFPKDDSIGVAVTEAPQGTFTVTDFVPPTVSYLLYYAVKMYFDNGGGKCYIVSVGTYQTPASITLTGDTSNDPTKNSGLEDGLTAVGLEDEPTLIVIPEAVNLGNTGYQTLAEQVLKQCGRLRDRFGVFDIPGGDTLLNTAAVDAARAFFGTRDLKYGAAYYPFLRTTITHYVNDAETNVDVTVGTDTPTDLVTFKTNKTAVYNAVRKALQPGEQVENFVVMPPSGAVTGAYADTDTKRGVWKAPANFSLNDVIEPMVKIDADKHGELNIDSTAGKSINAIRSFAGKGTLIWGARTLAGNDNEWRYVPVRRFFNMVEESIKKSTYWAVFEPNDANTWVRVRGMIENYLTQKWREGALAGATTKEAFFVRCGLGTTMNAQDILEGRMHVEIGLAVVRPAEFIILKFFHKLQTS